MTKYPNSKSNLQIQISFLCIDPDHVNPKLYKVEKVKLVLQDKKLKTLEFLVCLASLDIKRLLTLLKPILQYGGVVFLLIVIFSFLIHHKIDISAVAG